MANCFVCGRPLSNPASISRGVGPVCAGRRYRDRIMGRFGSQVGGWSKLEEWETANYPCYSCQHFQVPPSTGEDEIPGGYRISMYGCTRDFTSLNAIGGYCSKLKALVDGNQIGTAVECRGLEFKRRKPKEDLPVEGTLILSVSPPQQQVIPLN